MQGIDLQQIAMAWEEFIATGRTDGKAAAVRPAILRSWIRSRRANLDPFDRSRLPPVLPPRTLQQLRSKNAALLAVAEPVIRDLKEFVRGSGFVTVLTDGEGHILDVAGDRDSLAYARSIHLVPGSHWGETATGTNAMGLALAERQPVQVVGCEHYAKHLHDLTCSSAPIHDASGQIIGVLDMSGPCALAHPHTLGMVAAAARAVERQLHLIRANDAVCHSNATLEATVDSIREAVLVIDRHGIITRANVQAERILGVPVTRLAGRDVREILGEQPRIMELLRSGQSFLDEELTVSTPGGQVICLATARCVAVDQVNPHFILTLQEVRQVSRLVQRIHGGARFVLDDIIGVSDQMKQVKQKALKAARSDLTVLLLGESGTGKELLAHGIHNASARRDGPFIAVNCGAIPRDLLESELFGYEPGAFTGADRQGRPGKFELADGGTLFLDEIGDMPLEMQVSLLRVLQEKKVVRLGGARLLPVNVRVIAATHRDLAQEVKAGNFRADLLYRLDVLTIRVPPLRERPMDIPYLAERFLARSPGGERMRFHDRAMEALCQYAWPGNVRQLENVIAKCVHSAEGPVIQFKDLPAEIRNAFDRASPGGSDLPVMHQLERKAIEDACWQAGGNLSKAARVLGISRPTLYRKIKVFGIDLPREVHRLLH